MPNPSDGSDVDISALRRTPHKADPNFADIFNVRRGSSLANQVTLKIIHRGSKRPLIQSTTVMDKFSRKWVPNDPKALTQYQAQLAANELEGGTELGTLTFGLLSSRAGKTVEKFVEQSSAFVDAAIEAKTQGLLFRSRGPIKHAAPEPSDIALTAGTMIWANPASSAYAETETTEPGKEKEFVAESPATIYILTQDTEPVGGNYSVFGRLIGGTMNEKILDLMASQRGGPRTQAKVSAQERLQEAQAELKRLTDTLQIAKVERDNLQLAIDDEDNAGSIRRERNREFWDRLMKEKEEDKLQGKEVTFYPFTLIAKGLARKWVEHVKMTQSERAELADALDQRIAEMGRQHSAVKGKHDELESEFKSVAFSCGPSHQSPVCPSCGKILLSIITSGDKIGSIKKA